MVSRSSSGFQKTWNGAASKFGTWTFGISTKVPTANSTFSSTQNIGTKETQLTRTPSWLLLSVFQVPNFVNILEFFKPHFFNSASLLFWDNRQKRHHCFQENMMRGGRFEDGEDPIQVGIFIDPQANHFSDDGCDIGQGRQNIRRHRQNRHQQGLDPASPPLIFQTSFF